MKKTIYYGAILLCSLFLWISPAAAKTFDAKITADPYKVWNITFNSEILFNEETRNNIYVKTEDGISHPVSLELSKNGKTVKVKPTSPFLIGKNYSLIITKEVQSREKKRLKDETKMSFQIKGKYIHSVNAVLNPLVTNVVVQGTKDVQKMNLSINGTSEITLHKDRNDQFSRGISGLMRGDELYIRAYSSQGSLLEEQIYRISN